MVTKFAALLALAAVVYSAPIGKDATPYEEFLTIADNEPSTDMKVLAIAGSSVGNFPSTNDNAGLHFANLNSKEPSTVTLSVRIERSFSMRHARFNISLTNIKTMETESMMQYAYELEHVCAEGGMHRGEAHAFQCKKQSAIKTMKGIKLPMDWTKEKFENQASVMRIVMITDEDEVAFNTAFFAILA